MECRFSSMGVSSGVTNWCGDESSGSRFSKFVGAGVLLVAGFSPAGRTPQQLSLEGAMESLVQGREVKTDIGSLTTGVSMQSTCSSLSNNETTKAFTGSLADKTETTATSLAHGDRPFFRSPSVQESLKKLTGEIDHDIEEFEKMDKNIICVYKTKKPTEIEMRGESHFFEGYYWKLPQNISNKKGFNYYCLALTGSTTPPRFTTVWTRNKEPTNDRETEVMKELKNLNASALEALVGQVIDQPTYAAFEVHTGAAASGSDEKPWLWNGQKVDKCSQKFVDEILKESDGKIIWEKQLGEDKSIKILAMTQVPKRFHFRVIQYTREDDIKNIFAQDV